MSNSDSLCNSCAAPMCRWLLKMEACKGMEVVKEDRVNYNKKGGVDTVYVVTKCPKYQKKRNGGRRMRNRHEGVCYYCGKIVAAGDGHFEKIYGSRPAKWRVIHANCVFKQRAEKEKAAQSAGTDERQN